MDNHYVYLCIPEGFWQLGYYLAYDRSKNDIDIDKLKEFCRQPEYWNWVERAYGKFFSDGVEDYQHRALYGYYAAQALKWDLSYEQFHKSKMEFYSHRGLRSKENFLIFYSCACVKTKHYEEALEVAKTGLALNHCPHCNTQFQKYIDIAEAKLKKR